VRNSNVPSDRKDAIDLEHLEQTFRMQGWEIYRDRVKQMALQAGVDLINAENTEQFYERRGALKMINRVAGLPEILMQELKEVQR
jgi:hypothetical protein